MGELHVERAGEAEDHDKGINGNEFAELVQKATAVGPISLTLFARRRFVADGDFSLRPLLRLQGMGKAPQSRQ